MTDPATSHLRRLQEYERKVVSLLARTGQMKSTSTKFATVYAYFLTRRQLTQKQLQELTHFSSGSISQIVNQLLSLDVLTRNNIPGSHEKQYELARMETALVGSILRKLQVTANEYDSLISTATRDLEEIKGEVAIFGKKTGGDSLRQLEAYSIPGRIRRLETFLSEFSSILPLLRRMNEVIKAGFAQDAF